jgi:hypothetical protein
MTDAEKIKTLESRVKNTENSLRAVGGRLERLEEEMALCLKFMRVQAEKMAKEKDPDFKVHPSYEA